MLPRSWMEAYINFLLKFRWYVLVVLTLATLFLGFHVAKMQVQPNFFDFYPPTHEYIQLYQEYRRMFGTANILSVVIEANEGDIFNVHSINQIDKATRYVLETAGVNPYQILSLTHPKMRNIQISGAAITAYPIMYPAPPQTADDVKPIKKAVYTNEGVHRFYVAEDNSSALITAGFWEEGIDFENLFNRMETLKTELEVDGQREGVIKDPEALLTLEKFQRYMQEQEMVGGSISITTWARRLYQLFQLGIPKWAIIPNNPRDVGNIFYQFLNTVGSDDLDRFIDKTSTNATGTIYYKDYNHATVTGSIATAEEFIYNNPVEDLNFRLAGGLLGVLAAINDEVEWSYKWNLILVMVTVFTLSMLTYASVVGALIVMIPSIVAQPLSEGLMYAMGIDANINSLPVAAGRHRYRH